MSIRPAQWIDGVAVGGADMRLSESGLYTQTGPFQARSGSLGPVVLVTGQATPNMSVVVPAFVYLLSGTGSTTGSLRVVNDGQVTLTVPPSSASNPRLDIVTLRWGTESVALGLRGAFLEYLAGTPAATPVAPATPANGEVLAAVLVAKNATTISTGAITNTLHQTVAVGGVAVSRHATDVVATYDGQMRWRMDTSTLEVWSNNVWGPVKTGQTGSFPLPLFPQFSSNIGGGLAGLNYMRDSAAFVRLFGGCLNVGQYTANGADVVGQLPIGFRPPQNYQFVGAMFLGPGGQPNRAAYFQFQVNTDGILYIVHAMTGLDGNLAGENRQNDVPAGSQHHFSGATYPAA